jgi:hypothetical protein
MSLDVSKRALPWIGYLLCGVVCVICAACTKPQAFTGYPPSIYMTGFRGCAGEKACIQRGSFHVDQIPKGCCVLLVTNGDGKGADEMSSYEISLNGQQLLPAGNARYANVPVKLLPDNTLTAVLAGRENSKLFVLIAYDPRKPN